MHRFFLFINSLPFLTPSRQRLGGIIILGLLATYIADSLGSKDWYVPLAGRTG